VIRDRAIWRLVFNTEDIAMEEVVAGVQGILCRVELPPFDNKIASVSDVYVMKDNTNKVIGQQARK
jgi:hypothetical protein